MPPSALISNIGRRRREKREERRNTVGLKHALILGESVNISYRKGRRVIALGNC